MSENSVRAVIALGSNLGQRDEFLQSAIRAIAEEVGEIEQQSSIMQTAPLLLPDYAGPEVSDYLNMAIVVSTQLAPLPLLAKLHEIERTLGRHREAETQRWMSRVIDLDIIFYGDEVVETPTLQIPHPQMHNRDFVLKPMLEIAAQWRHPISAKSVSELYAELIG